MRDKDKRQRLCDSHCLSAVPGKNIGVLSGVYTYMAAGAFTVQA